MSLLITLISKIVRGQSSNQYFFICVKVLNVRIFGRHIEFEINDSENLIWSARISVYRT